MNEENDGRTELEHESERLYKKVFYIVLLITVLYLVIILAAS